MPRRAGQTGCNDDCVSQGVSSWILMTHMAMLACHVAVPMLTESAVSDVRTTARASQLVAAPVYLFAALAGSRAIVREVKASRAGGGSFCASKLKLVACSVATLAGYGFSASSAAVAYQLATKPSEAKLGLGLAWLNYGGLMLHGLAVAATITVALLGRDPADLTMPPPLKGKDRIPAKWIFAAHVGMAAFALSKLLDRDNEHLSRSAVLAGASMACLLVATLFDASLIKAWPKCRKKAPSKRQVADAGAMPSFVSKADTTTASESLPLPRPV